MAKKIKPLNQQELDKQADEVALHEKVAEYMGPPPDNPTNGPQPAVSKPKSGLKIVVAGEDEPTMPNSNELLPSDKLPAEIKQVAETPALAPEIAGPSAPAQAPPIGDSMNESDPEIDKAVDEIVSEEGDELLAAEDEARGQSVDAKTDPSSAQRPKSKLKQFFANWWGNPKYRKLTLIGLALLLIILLAVPPTRYFFLNSVGARSAASLTVLDESTSQPLKNVLVTIGDVSGETDREGKVKLSGVKLGPTKLIIEKLAFAKNERDITLGWGSNPLGDFRLSPTGVQYAFLVKDGLSGQPVAGAEAISGESSAISDMEGQILLTIDKSDGSDVQVSIVAADYRTEELTLDANTKTEQTIMLVPGRKHVFVSKRSGKYDLYKIDVDGKNEELLLAATGSERDDISLSVQESGEVAALVSTRDNQRTADGFLKSQLYIIGIKDGQKISLGSSEKFQLVGWAGDKLVYVKITEGASGDHPKRHRLMSYDYKTEENKELASANYFNDVMLIGTAVYYAPSAAYQPAGNIGFFRVNADGNNPQTILSEETWNILRSAYDKLSLSTPAGWYEYTAGEREAKKLPGPPSSTRNRFYANNPDNSLSLWIDERDGQTVLLAYNIAAKTEKVIQTEKGIDTPLRWLSSRHVIYRVNNDRETADYVINLDGGEAKKIRDVTNTSGLDNWYYYY